MRLNTSTWLLVFMLLATFWVAEAQPAAPARIGWISNDRGGNSPMFDAFRDEATMLFAALAARIERENDLLYPLAERVTQQKAA